MSNENPTIRIGLLGCGNVGGALVPLLARQADTIEARTGLRLEVTRVAAVDHYYDVRLPADVDDD